MVSYTMRHNNEGLTDIVKLIKKDSIMVEVGCFAGESTILFAKSENVSKLYAVDPWKNYPLDEGNEYKPIEDFNISMLKVKEMFDERMSVVDNVEVMQMTSEEAAEKFEDNTLDIVYIDGDHRYEFVKQDIELWLPKVRVGGILAGHDLCLRDVRRAIVETIGGEVDLILPDTSWLIYKKGGD